MFGQILITNRKIEKMWTFSFLSLTLDVSTEICNISVGIVGVYALLTKKKEQLAGKDVKFGILNVFYNEGLLTTL